MSLWQIKKPESECNSLVPANNTKNSVVDINALAEILTKHIDNRINQLTKIKPISCTVSVKSYSKKIMIGGEYFSVDSETLIRMIKQITQTIGEYKGMDNVYSRYIIPCLRKARSDMVSDLEKNFNIKWQIDKKSGESVFYA